MLSETVHFLKALASENRLKILGLLAQRDYTGEEIARILKVSPATVSHHLNHLSRANLVGARAEGYYSVYQLRSDQLQDFAENNISLDALINLTGDLDLAAFEKEVLEEYYPGGAQLTDIPSQPNRRKIVLNEIALIFKTGTAYTETQVDRLLAKIYDEPSELRDILLSHSLLNYSNDAYWRGKPPTSVSAGAGIWD